MARNGKPKPPEEINLAAWGTLDEPARLAMIEAIRPTMRDVAAGLGAKTATERAAALEAIGLASLCEAGWGLLVGRPTRESLGDFL